MNSNIIKIGSKIFVQKNGTEYKLENNKIYTLKYDSWTESSFLIESGIKKLPKEIVGTSINNFCNKVINYHKNNNESVGILFSGIKGGGKTMTCKLISEKSNLPTITIDNEFPILKLTDFFSSLKEDTCIIFDEIEKNSKYWNTQYLLGFLDGINSFANNIIMMTCNDYNKLDVNILNRCSRIRYHKKFNGLSEKDINEIINIKFNNKNKLKTKEEIDNIKSILNKVKIKSYDNILSICDEILNNENEDIKDLIDDMNIELIN